MIKLSVALATYNEENNIRACLESVKSIADELVVVDGSSTDKTVEIAESMGAKVINTSNKPMFHTNKNMAINACRGDWILQLDADERLTLELAEEIKKIINHPFKDEEPVAYWLKRKNYFLGRFLTKGGQYPDPVIRLFKKDKAILPAESVHEQMRVDGLTATLKNDLIHWATPTIARYFLRENRYASLEAEKLLKKPAFNLFSALNWLVFKPLITFLSIYIRHQGFVDGWQGLFFAFFSGFHFNWAYLKYLKMKIKKENKIKNWK